MCETQVLNDAEKERLADNIAEHSSAAQAFLQVRNTTHNVSLGT